MTDASFKLQWAARMQEQRAADAPLAKAVELLLAAHHARLQAVEHDRRATQ